MTTKTQLLGLAAWAVLWAVPTTSQANLVLLEDRRSVSVSGYSQWGEWLRDEVGDDREWIWESRYAPFGASKLPAIPFGAFDGGAAGGRFASFGATQDSWISATGFGGLGTAILDLGPEGFDLDEGEAVTAFGVRFQLLSPCEFELKGWTTGEVWGGDVQWYTPKSSHGMILSEDGGAMRLSGPSSGRLQPGIYDLSVWAEVAVFGPADGNLSAGYDFSFTVTEVPDAGASGGLLGGALLCLWLAQRRLTPALWPNQASASWE